MGYLRKTSFLIFHDPDAPAAEKTLNAREIAEIEAAHEAGKKDRIDALVWQQMGIEIPEVPTEWELVKSLRYEGKDVSEEVVKRGVAEADMKAKVAREAATARAAGPEGAPWREIVQAVQDESIVDEEAFKEYLRNTFKWTEQKYLRDFAWDVYGVVTSQAVLPDLAYRPCRESHTTVRFKGGDGLGINAPSNHSRWDDDEKKFVLTGETSPTLWVKIADGAWSKDGHWGGHLQVTCAAAEGQWIDSSNGWVRPQSSKGDPVTFYDMGPYYEIWQKDRETGRPLVVEDDYLRFAEDCTPGRFNLEDATWG
ncbi:hypothetical protein OV450_5273 [Actinobacteria bacterium OV450]|nr:hypothetical protein OV450_5273 [Actinobacteria bacterium OV450]